MTTKEREETIATLSAEGVPLDVIRALLRAGTTLHRLAERECNGDDWRDERGPRHFNEKGRKATDDEKTACGEAITAEMRGARRVTHRRPWVTCSTCKGSLIEARITKLCKAHGLTAVFNGDPRGAVLLVKVPSGRTNDWGGRGIVVG